MNLFSVAITAVFVVLLGSFAVLLILAIFHNLKVGSRYRQGIARQLSKLRLSRMLGIHRIDQNAYLHTQPIVNIRDQMKRCSECASTEDCDKLLDDGVGNQAEFCDNDETLKGIKKTIDPVK